MRGNKRRQILAILCLVMCLVSLTGYLYVSSVQTPSQSEAKETILANHTSETGANNAVTSIYLNYRLWDTLFEALVLLLSALAVISFSWNKSE